ncbi:MAG: hypothetical protein WEB58_23160 [Planctomycetaceae bacterium]
MTFQDRFRKYAAPSAAIVFIASCFLWVWTSGIYYRSLPTPACRLRLPFVVMQVAARDNGVHFLAMQNRAAQFPEIHFKKGIHFGRSGYHYGHVVNLLGFTVAVLPTRVIDYDYIARPYLAFVLPYWLLFVASGYVLVSRTTINQHLAPYCRFSPASSIAAGLVLLLMTVLNIVPVVSMPKPNIQPKSLAEWVTLTISPKNVYAEVMLDYGYPFTCLHNGIINGESVTFFHGASVGWKPHRAMENVMAAVLMAFMAVVAVNSLGQLIYGMSRPSGLRPEPL